MRYLVLIILNTFLINAGFGQKINVINELTNFLWIDISNPITVNYNGDCKNLVLKTNNGNVTKSFDCNFIATPNKAGKAKIEIFEISKKDTSKISEFSLKVKRLPLPTIFIGSITSSKTTSAILSNQNKLTAGVINFDFELNYEIVSYEVLIIRNNTVIFNNVYNGEMFPEKLKSEFAKLVKDDRVLFQKVITKNNKGEKIFSGSLELIIE